ncbi:hypothetical protein [Aquabacterium sp.]|uniref:hypothetical protein n=1 Tax=Aquabacterium sp. TaxID=1872578 RepID=UPI0025B7B27F|nr:hypothetical protein [Aquabacterium sp.]
MTKIIISIQYAGLTLPVVKNEAGEDCTPLKPISDLFGLRWRDQRQKVTGSAYMARFLGLSQRENDGLSAFQVGISPPVPAPELFIRLDRVAAFLMSINPDKVHAAGNVDGAKFLAEKHEEWADAVHDYEELGIAVNLNHARAQEAMRKQRAAFAQMIGVRNKTENKADRDAIGAVVKQMAGELGVSYQPDLL